MNKKPKNPQIQDLANKNAFSLIELSIVILVIGILIAGVMEGKKLVNKATISSARTLTNSSPVAGIKDLVAWYETTSERSFLDSVDPDNSSSNSISLWRDINQGSTLRCDLVQNSAGNQPKLENNVIGGLPAVVFNGTSSFMSCDQLASQYFSGGDKPMSIFTVFKFNAFSAQPIPLNFSNSTMSSPYIFINGTTGGNVIFNARGDSGQSLDAASYINVPLKAPFFLSYIYDGFSVSSYFNGNLRFSNERGYPSNSANEVSLNQFSLGAITRITPSWFYDGAIGEVIIFNRKLSREETNAVNQYLSKKWSIKM